jgi:hypothetical protein
MWQRAQNRSTECGFYKPGVGRISTTKFLADLARGNIGSLYSFLHINKNIRQLKYMCSMCCINYVYKSILYGQRLGRQAITTWLERLVPVKGGGSQWGRRLEGWPNTAARLVGWRRVTQQGVILYAMDGPCPLPWRTTSLGADLLLNE